MAFCDAFRSEEPGNGFSGIFYCHYAAACASAGYVKEPGLKNLAIGIFALCLLEAMCFFFTGWWAYSAYLSSGATALQAVTAAEGEWTTGLFILLGGLLHWVAPRLRIPLAVTGVFGGFYSAFLMIKSPNFLGSWNILHGDIVAIGTWSQAILIVLAVACAAELAILAKGTT
jgi:hypothetical protein